MNLIFSFKLVWQLLLILPFRNVFHLRLGREFYQSVVKAYGTLNYTTAAQLIQIQLPSSGVSVTLRTIFDNVLHSFSSEEFGGIDASSYVSLVRH